MTIKVECVSLRDLKDKLERNGIKKIRYSFLSEDLVKLDFYRNPVLYTDFKFRVSAVIKNVVFYADELIARFPGGGSLTDKQVEVLTNNTREKEKMIKELFSGFDIKKEKHTGLFFTTF